MEDKLKKLHTGHPIEVQSLASFLGEHNIATFTPGHYNKGSLDIMTGIPLNRPMDIFVQPADFAEACRLTAEFLEQEQKIVDDQVEDPFSEPIKQSKEDLADLRENPYSPPNLDQSQDIAGQPYPKPNFNPYDS